MIFLSEPVAFQNPFSVVLLGLPPFPCFLSLATKKYHSLSPIVESPAQVTSKQSYITFTRRTMILDVNGIDIYLAGPKDHDDKCSVDQLHHIAIFCQGFYF